MSLFLPAIPTPWGTLPATHWLLNPNRPITLLFAYLALIGLGEIWLAFDSIRLVGRWPAVVFLVLAGFAGTLFTALLIALALFARA